MIRSFLAIRSFYRTWGYRTLRTSPNSRPRAVKQLSNAELLSLVQEGKQDTTSPQDDQSNPSDTVLPQTSSRLNLRQPLPQSPLIDPQLSAARVRHRAKKPPPGGERSTFQSKLQKNPYAQALSTPPRLCLLTGVRLPSYFQIPFGVTKHPKTGAPWHLPKLSKITSGSDASITPPSPRSSPQSREPSDTKQGFRTAAGTHFIASRHALSYVSNLTRPAFRRLIPYRWKEDPALKITEIVWREDMDTFVLSMLRKGVAQDLAYLASRPAAYIAACKDRDNISVHVQISAVLWLGPDSEASAQDLSSASREKQGPPPYAMHYYKSYYMPCYNLLTLLGPMHVRALRESNPTQFSGQFAIMKAKRTTVKVQLELWKLLGYVAQQDEVADNPDGLSEQSV